MASELKTRNGEALDLVLYKFDSCPYCQLVMDAMGELGLQIPMRDTLEDPAARDELRRIGGKTQVPCLLINGRPLYESADIISYLEREVAGPSSGVSDEGSRTRT